MGMFDEYLFPPAEQPAQPTAPPPATAPPATAPTGGNMFDTYINPQPPVGSNLPGAAPAPTGWENFNKPFGELRNPDPVSWSEWLRQKGQDALIAMGMKPYDAGHFAKGAIDTAKLAPPVSMALGGLDLTHDVRQGNVGAAMGDVLSMAPGALAGTRVVRGMPTIRMADTPSPGEALQAGRNAYGRVANAPVEFVPQAGDNLINGTRQILEHPSMGGFGPEKAPAAHAVLDRFQTRWQQRGTNITPQDLDALRSQLRGLEGADGVAGNRAVDVIDHYLQAPPQRMVASGSPADFAAVRADLAEARGNWRAGRTAGAVEENIDRSGTKARTANSGLNVDNRTRQGLASLVTTDAGEARIFGARPDEREAITRVAEGDALTNWQRKWGNRLGGGGGIGQGAIASSGAGLVGSAAHLLGADPVTAIGAASIGGMTPAIVGGKLRQAANERTVRAAEDLVGQIARNSPLYAAREAASPPIADPRVGVRDAITYALMPKVSQSGVDAWNNLFVPYENR